MAEPDYKDFYELRELLAPFEGRIATHNGKPIREITPDTDPKSETPAMVRRVEKLGLDNSDRYDDLFGGDCELDDKCYELRYWDSGPISYWHFIEREHVKGDLDVLDRWLYQIGTLPGGDALAHVMRGKLAGQLVNVGHDSVYVINFDDYRTDEEMEGLISGEQHDFIVPMGQTLEQYFIGWIKAANAGGQM